MKTADCQLLVQSSNGSNFIGLTSNAKAMSILIVTMSD